MWNNRGPGQADDQTSCAPHLDKDGRALAQELVCKPAGGVFRGNEQLQSRHHMLVIGAQEREAIALKIGSFAGSEAALNPRVSAHAITRSAAGRFKPGRSSKTPTLVPGCTKRRKRLRS